MDEQRWSDLRDEVRALRARIEAIEREMDGRISAPEPAPAPNSRRAAIETRFGLTLLNRIGVVTLILGAAFFFKYAVDSEWIGPWPRVALGLAAGAASLLAADYLIRREQKPFAQGIAGLGIALLFVSLYAGFGFYRLYSAGIAIVLMLVPAGLALRYDSLPVVLLGLFGGYATPAVIDAGAVAGFGFVLLIDLIAAWQARRRDWLAVEIMALAGTTYIFGVNAREPAQWVATAFLAACYALFTLSRTDGIRQAAQILTAIGALLVWRDQPSAFLLCSLALAGCGLRVQPAGLIGFWLAWALWSPDSRPAGPSFVAATLVFGAYYVLGATRVAAALNGVAYFTASFLLLDPQHHAWMGPLAFGVAAAHFVAARRGAWRDLNHGLAAAFVAAAIAVQFTGFVVTVGWAIEAAALARLGLPVPALIALAAVAARLGRFDVIEPEHMTILNGRFTAFFAAAVSYWLASRHLPWRRIAAVVYSLGHVILIWAGGLEIASWAIRNSAPAEHASIITAGISILGAVYAAVLIAAGVLTGAALNRALGLGLIALVIVKLYAYDVWLLQRRYRTTAFIALGALLVLSSYLYSRYRDRIEAWWRERA